MAVAPVKLVSGAALGTTPAVLCAIGGNVKVTAPTFTNTTATAITVTVTVSYGGGVAKTITSVQPIAANSTFLAAELSGQVFGSGDSISAFASAVGINAFISGVGF